MICVKMDHLFLYAILIFMVFHSGASIRCFECDSTENGELCGSAFKSNQVKTVLCDANALTPPERQVLDNVGTKTKFTCLAFGFTAVQGKKDVVRKCTLAPVDDDDLCPKFKVLYNALNVQMDFCNVCNEDLCNGVKPDPTQKPTKASNSSKNSINFILTIASFFTCISSVFIYYSMF